MFIYTVAILHIMLFTYAAVSKIMDFQNFEIQLGQSPLLTIFAGVLAYAVPTIEIVIAIFLIFPKTRIPAIYASCFLMILFTIYIVMILNFTSFIPCSCGGVLEKLNWNEHLLFNIFFVAIALIAIKWHTSLKHTTIVFASFGGIGITLMSALFLLSEDIMQNENPFIRRFPQGTAAMTAKIDLRNPDFYIAGVSKEKIFLGNRKAQLQVVVIDKSLKNRKQYAIKLNKENANFRNITIRVQNEIFYVFDGTAFVIYKGTIKDWKASMISEKEFGFNDIQFISNKSVMIRGRKPNRPDNILAKVTQGNPLKFKINDNLLQKQIDGFFDTDGTMSYSFEFNKLIYTYYYRNEYIVIDSTLTLVHRGNTIDTTSKAKIKIAKIEKSGDIKLAAPPYRVNKGTTVTNNLLFVNSVLRGKYENKKVWKSATAVDVYDFTNHKYLLSFYVHDIEGERMRDFYATSDALYLIAGTYLVRYDFGQRIKSKISKNLPAGNRKAD